MPDYRDEETMTGPTIYTDRVPNRLITEASPYLRQHATNPVDWYPWGEEALSRSKAEDKPILLSIGYSACHWCHVMAHESFENAEIAELMTRSSLTSRSIEKSARTWTTSTKSPLRCFWDVVAGGP